VSRPYLVKLVRDRVGQFLGRSEVTYERIGDDATWLKMLRMKLIEEAVEYALDPSIGEAGDVLDALKALADHDLNVRWEDVEIAAAIKTAERGAFNEGMGMYVTTTAPR
jgi:predicted house-cleaning noncanonical NTP pyrophosphatase (MazG superfamily)